MGTGFASSLPAEVLPPLRMLEEEVVSEFPWFLVLGLVLLFAVAELLRRRYRGRQAEAASAPRVEAGVSETGPWKELEQLRKRVREERAWRRGCDELAALLREHGGRWLGRSLTSRTVVEIEAVFGEHPMPGLLDQLAELQFSSREPEREDFEAVADLAAETASSLRQGGKAAA